MAAVTSVRAERCCHLVSAHEASVQQKCSSTHQLMIYGAFVLVYSLGYY